MMFDISRQVGVVVVNANAELHRRCSNLPSTRCVQLDGLRSRDGKGFYDEISRALGFPDYFGRNLNALVDCMRDEYKKSENPLLLWISHADDLFADRPATTLHGLLSTFAFIAEEWWAGMPGDFGEPPYPRRLLVVLEYGSA